MSNSFNEIIQNGLDPIESGSYCIDVAIPMDATGSMSPIIEEVKSNAVNFCHRFHEAMEATGKSVSKLRIKVIPFRDYKADGSKAMDESPFFELPEQNEEFKSYVDGISAMGGGDEPENSLEALSLAMRSDWTTEGAKRRHVIPLFTDASAHPLQSPACMKNPLYPEDMPADLAELGDRWNGIGQDGMPEPNAARLVLFTPNVKPWCDMQTWNNVWVSFSQAGTGLNEVDMDMAIQLLVNSVK